MNRRNYLAASGAGVLTLLGCHESGNGTSGNQSTKGNGTSNGNAKGRGKGRGNDDATATETDTESEPTETETEQQPPDIRWDVAEHAEPMDYIVDTAEGTEIEISGEYRVYIRMDECHPENNFIRAPPDGDGTGDYSGLIQYAGNEGHTETVTRYAQHPDGTWHYLRVEFNDDGTVATINGDPL